MKKIICLLLFLSVCMIFVSCGKATSEKNSQSPVENGLQEKKPSPTMEPTNGDTPLADPTRQAKPSADPINSPAPSPEPTNEATPAADPTHEPELDPEPAKEATPAAEPNKPVPDPEPTGAITPDADANKRDFVTGNTFFAGNFKFTVNGVRFGKGNDFFWPAEGNEYYVVSVTIENVSSGTITLKPLSMFVLRESKGKGNPVSVVPDADFMPLNVDLAPKENATGEVGFQLPIGSEGLVLHIDPYMGDGPLGQPNIYRVKLDNPVRE